MIDDWILDESCCRLNFCYWRDLAAAARGVSRGGRGGRRERAVELSREEEKEHTTGGGKREKSKGGEGSRSRRKWPKEVPFIEGREQERKKKKIEPPPPPVFRKRIGICAHKAYIEQSRRAEKVFSREASRI